MKETKKKENHYMTPLLSYCNSNKKSSLSSRSKLAFDFQWEPLAECEYMYVLHKRMDISKRVLLWPMFRNWYSKIVIDAAYVRWSWLCSKIRLKEIICARNKHLNWTSEKKDERRRNIIQIFKSQWFGIL